MTLPETAIDVEGHVTKGTRLDSKAELLQLLEAWLHASEHRPSATPVNAPRLHASLLTSANIKEGY
jgi:hypothetical protein